MNISLEHLLLVCYALQKSVDKKFLIVLLNFNLILILFYFTGTKSGRSTRKSSIRLHLATRRSTRSRHLYPSLSKVCKPRDDRCNTLACFYFRLKRARETNKIIASEKRSHRHKDRLLLGGFTRRANRRGANESRRHGDVRWLG